MDYEAVIKEKFPKYDVEVITNIVAHKIMACNCPMRDGEKLSGSFPREASVVKQYGPKLKAFAVNLLTQGYVSIDRTRQILEGLGIPVSTGTLQNFLDSCALETASAADEIRKRVAALDVIHCDETGVDVKITSPAFFFFFLFFVFIFSGNLFAVDK